MSDMSDPIELTEEHWFRWPCGALFAVSWDREENVIRVETEDFGTEYLTLPTVYDLIEITPESGCWELLGSLDVHVCAVADTIDPYIAVALQGLAALHLPLTRESWIKQSWIKHAEKEAASKEEETSRYPPDSDSKAL